MQVFEHACCATKGARAYQEDTALVHSGAAVPSDGGSIPLPLLASPVASVP